LSLSISPSHASPCVHMSERTTLRAEHWRLQYSFNLNMCVYIMISIESEPL
jgi:hypothetical protein